MLAVSFQDPDPQIAAQVATSVVNGYLEYNFRQKDEAIRRSGWMEQQMEALKANVEKSQRAVVTYEQQNQIVFAGDKQNVLEQMLADQSRDVTSAKSDRIQKESLYRQVLANRGTVGFSCTRRPARQAGREGSGVEATVHGNGCAVRSQLSERKKIAAADDGKPGLRSNGSRIESSTGWLATIRQPANGKSWPRPGSHNKKKRSAG